MSFKSIYDKTLFRIISYACKMCSFVADTILLCKVHMDQEHSDRLNRTVSVSSNVSSEGSVIVHETSEPCSSGSLKKQTVHTNPDWCRNLKNSFKTQIVSKCCQRTKDAVDNNEAIKVLLDTIRVNS